MNDLTLRLSNCYASAIHDVLREKGYENCVLPPEIQALEKGQKIFGEIYTISGFFITLYLDMIHYFCGHILSRFPREKSYG